VDAETVVRVKGDTLADFVVVIVATDWELVVAVAVKVVVFAELVLPLAVVVAPGHRKPVCTGPLPTKHFPYPI
jgi:hypothetical protein